MPYIGNQPGTGVRSRFIYTATASQTTFSGADDNGKTLKYADSDFVDVYLNGICLVPVTDYTSTSKTSVVLTQAASLNDTLEVIAYDIATMADTVSKADGGTFEGDLGITNASPDITLTNNTTEDTDGGRESTVTFKGLQSGGEESTLAEIRASHDATADDQKGDLIFKTNDGSDGVSPTERLRIDSSGSVIIGETSPINGGNFNLATSADSAVISTLVRSTNVDHTSKIIFQKSSTNSGNFAATRTNEALGQILFRGVDTSSVSKVGASIEAIQVSQASGSAPSRMAFNVSGSEAMRIGSDGALLVGTTSNASSGKVAINYARGSSAGMRIQDTVGSGGTGVIADFYNSGGSSIGSITHNSFTTDYNTTSDYRLKENVTDVTDGITRVKQLSPKRFNWIADESNTTVDGFLAHEAQEVVPEAVIGTKDAMTEEVLYVDDDEIPDGKKVGDVKTASKIDPQGIDQSKIVPLLTAALQEAIAKIETLETKVAALEAE